MVDSNYFGEVNWWYISMTLKKWIGCKALSLEKRIGYKGLSLEKGVDRNYSHQKSGLVVVDTSNMEVFVKIYISICK